jgi:hypothetical protein
MISNKTERRIIAVAIGIISGCISFSFYSDGVTGAKLIIVAGLVIALKTGEFFFAMDIFNYWNNQPRQTYKAAGSALLVAVFYCLSVAATSISWYMQPQKEVAKLDVQRDVIKTLQADVEQAKTALESCPPMTFKNCITPKTVVLKEKQDLLTAAIADSGKLSDVIATAKTWDGIAAFFNTDRATLEFGRDLIGGMLFDLIGILFFAQSGGHETSEKKQVQQLRIDTPQPDIIPTAPPVDYQAAPVVSEWANFEQQQKNIVKSIMDLPAGRSVAILGQSGFGKSSLLGHLGIEALNRGHTVFALDPHFNITESSFDPRCQIIGKTANGMAEIKNFIFWLKKELDKRELELKTVPYVFDTWQTYVVLMDEMFEVINQTGLTKEFAVMYTKMRKYKIVFLGISQSFNVKSMGVDGNQDLLKTFEIFQLSGADNGYKITHAVLDDNGKKRIIKGVFEHPGTLKFSHIPQTKQPDFKPMIDSIVNVPAKELKKSLNSDIFS